MSSDALFVAIVTAYAGKQHPLSLDEIERCIDTMPMSADQGRECKRFFATLARAAYTRSSHEHQDLFGQAVYWLAFFQRIMGSAV